VSVILFVAALVGYLILKSRAVRPVVTSLVSTEKEREEITTDARKTGEEIREDIDKGVDSSAKKFESAGLGSADDLKKELDAETKKMIEGDPNLTCAIKPSAAGCGANYILNAGTGCCDLKPGKKPSPMEAKVALAKTIGTEIAVGIIAGEIMEKMILKGPRLAAKGAVVAGKMLAKLAPKLGAKLAATGAKHAATASTGPPGWIVSAIMLAFDAISLTLDLLDVDGYNSYTSNDVISNMRKMMDFSLWKSLKDAGMDFPMMFPLAEPFQNEFEAAQNFMGGEMFNKFVMKDIEETPAMKAIWDGFLNEAIENPDVELPEQITDFTVKTIEKYHKERDLIIFTKLQDLLGDEKYKVELYEFMSTPKRIGISLSEKFAGEWNTQQRETWFKNNDLFKPPKQAIDYVDPTAALYTDTYYVLDTTNPGTEDKPNMIPKKLPKKTVLGCAYGTIITFCEKRRQLKGISDAVDPRKLGVKFDMGSGQCKFTKEFCIRYGMVFSKNNCKLNPGQAAAEMILGPTVTRASVREWEDRKAAFTSGDPVQVAGAVLKTVYDPTGLGTASVKRLIKEINETKAKKTTPAKKIPCPPGMRDDGTSCWSDTIAKKTSMAKKRPCPPGMRDDGTSCWRDTIAKKTSMAKKRPCPPGMRDDRTSCWKDTVAKKSSPARKRPCPPGMRDDGTSCWKDTVAKRSSLAKKKACPSGMRDDGTSCWLDSKGRGVGVAMRSTGGGCTGGGCKRWGKCSKIKCSKIKWYCPSSKPEKSGSLCYKRCPPGYRGVGPMCHPKSGAGIKVTVFKRHYCPPGQRNVAGRCWPSCPSGYKDIGTLCHPPGGPGIKVTLFKRQYCPPGMRNVAGTCWASCPSGYRDIGAVCHPPGGPGIKVTLMKRQYCPPGMRNVAGVCWRSCPSGFKDIGALCEPKGGPGIKQTLMQRQYCPPGMRNVAGVCWQSCPSGFKDIGALCEPKGGPGIKKDLWKRQSCPPGMKNVGGVCWSKCPPGYRDDGALCNKN